MIEFLKQEYAVIMLAVLFFVSLGQTLHVMHAKDVDPATLAWAQGLVTTILGALLLALQSSIKKPDKPADPNPPAQQGQKETSV